MSRIPSCVLINYHRMLGIDPHMGCPVPLSLTPIPPLMEWHLHVVAARLKDLIWTTGKSNSDVLAEGGEVMALRTDIGRWIPHFAFTNNLWLMALHSACSSSISFFGASGVVTSEGPVATSNGLTYHTNLNCGTPFPTPVDVVFSNNTVLAGMTPGDFLDGYQTMLFIGGVTAGLNWLYGAAATQMRISFGGGTNVDVDDLFDFVGGTCISWLMGTPVGYSVPTAPLGSLDWWMNGEKRLMDLFNSGGEVDPGGEAIRGAVGDYYENPNIPSFP